MCAFFLPIFNQWQPILEVLDFWTRGIDKKDDTMYHKLHKEFFEIQQSTKIQKQRV
jgi:hypothetical protein